MISLLCQNAIVQRKAFPRVFLVNKTFHSTDGSLKDDKNAISIEVGRIKKFQYIWSLFRQDDARCLPEQKNLFLPPSWLVKFCFDAVAEWKGTNQMTIDYTKIEQLIQKANPNYHSDLATITKDSEEFLHDHRYESNGDLTDHYLDHKIRIFSEEAYEYRPYDKTYLNALPEDITHKLCAQEITKKYLQIGEAYSFPRRDQIPTSWGTEPAKLLVDPDNPTPTIYLQLSERFPPATWIPVRPTVESLGRVLTEFATFASVHREVHHDKYIKRWNEAKVSLVNQKMVSADAMHKSEETSRSIVEGAEINSQILRYVGWMARNLPLHEVPLREFPNSQEFFCGDYESPERFMEYLESCPFFFAIPELRTDSKDLWGQADGPGIAISAFRCIFSKTLIWVKVHFSTEVKLPPTDTDLFKKIWKEQTVYPATVTPVFIRVVWPDNIKMCGGGGLIRRFNEIFGTEFARDIPIDAAMALIYCTAWARRQNDFLGVKRMRERLVDWEKKVNRRPQNRRPDFGAYPGTAELPSPMYTDKERLGMHLQYLAHLGDPDIGSIIRRWMGYDSGAIRFGCAKAALESGNTDLFLEIIQKEPPGRFRKSMLRCFRSRKKRDLYDKMPRIQDEEFDGIRCKFRPVALHSLSAEELENRIRLEGDKDVDEM